MKFSEQWLREWVNPEVSTDALLEQLTLLGLEDDGITDVSGKFSGVVVGEIVAVSPHPQSEHLYVCQVRTAPGADTLPIITAATNARAEIKVAVACVGAIVGLDQKIVAQDMKGITSQGMFCSSQELGLTDTASTILQFPHDAPVGEDVFTYMQLADHTIALDLTPNRGDCLSLRGIAREVGVSYALPINAPEIQSIPATQEDPFPIEVTATQACPHYVARVIRRIDPTVRTPVWMKERLRRSGLRSIHPVVDVNNYVMLELGQPMHAFDLQQLSDTIQVRMAQPEERLLLLDGREVTVDPETLVIADQQHPVAIAGVMGDLTSGVTEATHHILLESAYFDPILIAKTARRFGLHTDSSHRFERGVDPHLQREAIERATALLLAIVGGEPGPVMEHTTEAYLPQPAHITFRPDRARRILGAAIPDDRMSAIFERLGFSVKQDDKAWQITVPTYRFDLRIEEDLIEEVARVYGYDAIPATLPTMVSEFHPIQSNELTLQEAQRLLCDLDYHETINYSFVDPGTQATLHPDQRTLSLLNPITQDLSDMRVSLWSGLLKVAEYNQKRQQHRIRLFETGLTFTYHDGVLQQKPMIAGLVCGGADAEQWGLAERPVDFYDLKGDVEALLGLTDRLPGSEFIPIAHPTLHPGQACQIQWKGQVLGTLGRLHPDHVRALDLLGPLYLFELSLNALTDCARPRYKEVSKFPSIRRDLALLVRSTVPAMTLCQVITDSAGELLTAIQIFDVYQGSEVKSGHKSIAVRLIMQHDQRTLQDDEVAELMSRVINALQQQCQATLRD